MEESEEFFNAVHYRVEGSRNKTAAPPYRPSSKCQDWCAKRRNAALKQLPPEWQAEAWRRTREGW